MNLITFGTFIHFFLICVRNRPFGVFILHRTTANTNTWNFSISTERTSAPTYTALHFFEDMFN